MGKQNEIESEYDATMLPVQDAYSNEVAEAAVNSNMRQLARLAGIGIRN